MQLVLFTLSGFVHALPLAAVERVFPLAEIVPLPGAPEIVEGVINLSGSIVPVFNIRCRLRLPEKPHALTDRIILSNAGKRKVGLIADSIGEVTTVDAYIEAGCLYPGLEHVGGVAKIGGDIVLIHDLEAFLSPHEKSALDAALEEV